MFCLLVSPDPLRRALLLSDSEQPSPAASHTVAAGDASPATPAAAVSHHVAVDIPDEEDGGGGDDPDAEESLEMTQYISPVRRAAFVAYTALAAPALVTDGVHAERQLPPDAAGGGAGGSHRRVSLHGHAVRLRRRGQGEGGGRAGPRRLIRRMHH